MPKRLDGLVVSAGPWCRVALTKVSYDDPGPDDAEFIELHVTPILPESPAVDGAAPPAPNPMPACDGSSVVDGGSRDAGSSHGGERPTDAGREPSVLRLADCGLTALELVDGANGQCETYRTLTLADVLVPADRYVVICAKGSAVDRAASCDVTTAGRSSLRDGWLQNGPGDGLRFVGANDPFTHEVAYEAAPACFGPASVALVPETGEVAAPSGKSDPVDDVNVYCATAFELAAAPDAVFRAPNPCRHADTSRDAGGPGAAALADAGDDRAGQSSSKEAGASWHPELAPPPRGGSSAVEPDPYSFDAGAFTLPETEPSPRHPPGCSLPPVPLRAGRAPLIALCAAALVRVLRRRPRSPSRFPPRRAALRAGSAARCGLPRSR